MNTPDYQYYNQLFKQHTLPLAYLDLDYLNQNIEDIAQRAGQKTIRIASKSVRSVWVLRYILNANPIYQGIMSFTGAEALYLIEQGFDNILLGYPIINQQQIREICKQTKEGKKIILMADSTEHLELINKIATEEQTQQPICIDIDMSSDILGIHFGVYRSSITDVRKAEQIIQHISNYSHIKLIALMGYEAQIAGIGDFNPTNGIKNIAIKLLKKKSIPEYQQRRAEIVHHIQAKLNTLEIVNVGGTGSMEWNTSEAIATEITVGSGFYAPALFDYYNNFKHLPALGFALPIVRRPNENTYTCLGGGYIASGSTGLDKQPKVFLPKEVEIIANEGFGEVQTPFVYKGKELLNIGDSILFRHSKAGELCERFNQIYVVSKGAIIDIINTYRGDGRCFL